MVHLRCTVPGRCPRDTINQGGGGGGSAAGGRLPLVRNVFNISGDERNRMVEARGFPQEWWRAARNRCVVCLLAWPPNHCSSTSANPPATPHSFPFSVLFSHLSLVSLLRTFPIIFKSLWKFQMKNCPPYYILVVPIVVVPSNQPFSVTLYFTLSAIYSQNMNLIKWTLMKFYYDITWERAGLYCSITVIKPL